MICKAGSSLPGKWLLTNSVTCPTTIGSAPPTKWTVNLSYLTLEPRAVGPEGNAGSGSRCTGAFSLVSRPPQRSLQRRSSCTPTRSGR